MKIGWLKIIFGISCLSMLSYANDNNENIDRSLKNQFIKVDNVEQRYTFDTNALDKLKSKALAKIVKSLNMNPKLFDKKEKFSLYVRIASTSKFGFRYNF